MADSGSGNLTLPSFEAGKTYMLTGETLMSIIEVIRENRVVLTGEKQFDEIGPNGSLISLDDLGGGCGKNDPPASGTYVCGSIDGTKQWIATQECACTELDGGDAG